MQYTIINIFSHIKVLSSDLIDKQEWNSFISNNCSATYFSSSDYLDAFNNVYYILLRDVNDKLIAGLPVIIRIPLPFIGKYFKTCSLESAVLCNNSLSDYESIDVKYNVLLALKDFLVKEGIVYCYISHWIRSHDFELFRELGFEHQPEGTILIDLSMEEKRIVSNFKSGYKHALNKAKRFGVRFEVLEGLNSSHLVSKFCLLRTKTQIKAKRKNKNASMMLKSEKFIYSILSSKFFKTHIATAYLNNQIAHIVLFVSLNKTVYAYLSGSNVKLNNKSGAANYLYYKMILYAKSKGLKYLDMGGTPINPDKSHPAYGVYFFKKSFGGELHIYDGGYLIINKIRGKVLHKVLKMRNVVRFIDSIFRIK